MRSSVLVIALVLTTPPAAAESPFAHLECAIGAGAADRAPRHAPAWDRELAQLLEFGEGARIDLRDNPDYYVSFTFDDGPRAETTPAVLDALDRYDVPGLFFVTGWRFAGDHPMRETNAALLDEILARGYRIGNHTFQHKDLTTLAPAAARQQIDRTSRALRARLGFVPHAFRAPFGRTDRAVRDHLRNEGFTEMRWTIDSKDFHRGASARILRARVVRTILAENGGVVLMHDTKDSTAESIAGILDDLEAENCRRLAAGERPIVPVSLHYFVKNRDGTRRPVPPRVAARTTRYLTALPGRCKRR